LTEADTPYLATRLRTPHFATPKCTPYTSPRSTPGPSRSGTPRGGTPADRSRAGTEEREDQNRASMTRTLIHPRMLSELTDLSSMPGQNGEIKCYLISSPGN